MPGACEYEVVDLFGYVHAGCLWALWHSSDRVKVPAQGSVSCSELCQYEARRLARSSRSDCLFWTLSHLVSPGPTKQQCRAYLIQGMDTWVRESNSISIGSALRRQENGYLEHVACAKTKAAQLRLYSPQVRPASFEPIFCVLRMPGAAQTVLNRRTLSC
jgi:hypothetical protein